MKTRVKIRVPDVADLTAPDIARFAFGGGSAYVVPRFSS